MSGGFLWGKYMIKAAKTNYRGWVCLFPENDTTILVRLSFDTFYDNSAYGENIYNQYCISKKEQWCDGFHP